MACGDPGGAKCAGIASTAGVMDLSESCFKPLLAGDQKALLGKSFSVALPIQALRGLPCLGSFSVLLSIRQAEGTPMTELLLYRLVSQELKRTP